MITSGRRLSAEARTPPQTSMSAARRKPFVHLRGDSVARTESYLPVLGEHLTTEIGPPRLALVPTPAVGPPLVVGTGSSTILLTFVSTRPRRAAHHVLFGNLASSVAHRGECVELGDRRRRQRRHAGSVAQCGHGRQAVHTEPRALSLHPHRHTGSSCSCPGVAVTAG